ncbi:MAG: acyl-CoA dehydrogenase family protein [Deltaproteobacteria bacterium]|nr:acyl-CoA dehydrogenase family protein [Deltaproteobacteria bacterium]
MDLRLSTEQQMIVDAVRDFAQGRLAPRAAEVDATGVFPLDAIRECAALGLCAMNVPEDAGGTGVGPVAAALAIQELARADASISVTQSVTNMVAEAIWRFGNPDQWRRFIPMAAAGDYPIGAFVLTEPGAGSDATAQKTTAVLDGDAYVINGTKNFITSAAYAGVFIVMARAGKQGSKGISAFLVERGAPGMRVGKEEDKMGLRGSNTAELVFENCRVPVENRLGEEGIGFKVAMSALDGGRINVASQALGIARAALRDAVEYAKTREAFGKPIAELQAIQWKIADMATQLDAAEMLILRAAWLKQEKRPYTREASMAKLYSTEAANRAVKEALQVLGGYGYCRDYPLERYFRDCKVTTIYEGTSEIQRLVIARHTLAMIG